MKHARLFAAATMAILLTAFAVRADSLPELTGLASRCGPAVVNINSERSARAPGPEEFFGEMFRNLPPGAERFFEQFGFGRGRRMPQKQKSLGSGFLISADGYVVTNNHVVAGADVINVTLDAGGGRGRTLAARLVGTDEDTDLALLKIDVKDQPFLRFGDSDKLRVGEWLMAIGNPFGLDHSVTTGILSAKNRNIRSGPYDNFLQTDAAINPGNSGGPLLNMAGEVIGINTAISANGQGIGFAIPSNMAAQVTEQLKTGQKVSRGWLGIAIQDVDENTAKALGMEKPAGALVGNVMPDEPGARAGLEGGDVIMSVDGDAVVDASALLRLIASRRPGSKAELGVWRNGRTEKLTVTLGERASQGDDRRQDARKSKDDAILGISLRALRPNERRERRIERDGGLLVTGIDEDKPVAELDIRPGDVILRANSRLLLKPSDLAAVVADEGAKRGAVLLHIVRGGDNLVRAVPVPQQQ